MLSATQLRYEDNTFARQYIQNCKFDAKTHTQFA